MHSFYRLVVAAMVSILLLWFAGQAGLLRAPEGWLYDRMVSWSLHADDEDSRVLLVEVDRGDATRMSGEWHSLIDKLEGLGAAQVALGFEPAGAGQALFQLAAEWGNVVLGRSPAPSFTPGRYRLPEWPDFLDGMMLPFGVLTVPPAEHGIHRRSMVSVELEKGGRAPTLEAAVAARGSDGAAVPDQQSFLVNFNQGRAWLPSVSAERVLNDGLVPDLVSGRAVLIGLADAPGDPGLHAPIAVQGKGLTRLEYQGFALDTLLRNRHIREVLAPLLLLVMLAAGAGSLMAYQWLGIRAGGWLAGSVIAFIVGFGWLLLHVFSIRLPVVELSIAQALVFVLFARFRLVDDWQQIRQSVLARATQAKGGVLPPPFDRMKDPWTAVTRLVDQLHELTRFVILEAIPGEHRVRHVALLHCVAEDIAEPGRDFESVPYSTAVASGKPVPLEDRPFLKPRVDGPETQYLAPLLYDGKIQGFWVFGAEPGIVGSASHFITRVEETAAEIASLLYQRRHREDSEVDTPAGIRRVLHLDAQDRVHREVEQTLGALDRQLRARGALLHGIGTAVVVYDLFGRVVQMNRSMEELMRSAGLRLYDMTALELLVKVSGMSPRRGRTVMQRVVADRRQFYVPVLPRMKKGEQYSVMVRPLEAWRRDHVPAPFRLSGILVEFVDITRVAQLLWPKGQILERLQWRLRNDLEALSAAGFVLRQAVHAEERERAGTAQDVETAPDPAEGRHRKALWAVDLIESKIEGIRSALEHQGPDLDEFAGHEEPVFYPSNLQAALVDVIRELTPAATQRDIRFEIEQPAVVGLVQAHPQQLVQLLKAVLTTLLGDAGNSTGVCIEMAEQEGFLEVDFFNTGFGVPDERFQAYLQDPDYPAAEDFRQLRDALRPVGEWGGEVELHSEVGVGIWGVLRLPVAS